MPYFVGPTLSIRQGLTLWDTTIIPLVWMCVFDSLVVKVSGVTNVTASIILRIDCSSSGRNEGKHDSMGLLSLANTGTSNKRNFFAQCLLQMVAHQPRGGTRKKAIKLTTPHHGVGVTGSLCTG
ncbi:unnamed protein product, partial [Discosporangium mesarthrocarpum]